MIELDHLVKKFGDLTAVNDLTLTIGRGEFFAMLGPNAAGKTTTIKMLAGLIKPTAGAARICGFDIQTAPLAARQRLAVRRQVRLASPRAARPRVPWAGQQAWERVRQRRAWSQPERPRAWGPQPAGAGPLAASRAAMGQRPGPQAA